MASSYDDLLLQNTKLLNQNEADSSSFVVKTTVDLVAPEPPESKVINIANIAIHTDKSMIVVLSCIIIDIDGDIEIPNKNPDMIKNAVEEMLRFDSPVVNSGA